MEVVAEEEEVFAPQALEDESKHDGVAAKQQAAVEGGKDVTTQQQQQQQDMGVIFGDFRQYFGVWFSIVEMVLSSGESLKPASIDMMFFALRSALPDSLGADKTMNYMIVYVQKCVRAVGSGTNCVGLQSIAHRGNMFDTLVCKMMCAQFGMGGTLTGDQAMYLSLFYFCVKLWAPLHMVHENAATMIRGSTFYNGILLPVVAADGSQPTAAAEEEVANHNAVVTRMALPGRRREPINASSAYRFASYAGFANIVNSGKYAPSVGQRDGLVLVKCAGVYFDVGAAGRLSEFFSIFPAAAAAAVHGGLSRGLFAGSVGGAPPLQLPLEAGGIIYMADESGANQWEMRLASDDESHAAHFDIFFATTKRLDREIRVVPQAVVAARRGYSPASDEWYTAAGGVFRFAPYRGGSSGDTKIHLLLHHLSSGYAYFVVWKSEMARFRWYKSSNSAGSNATTVSSRQSESDSTGGDALVFRSGVTGMEYRYGWTPELGAYKIRISGDSAAASATDEPLQLISGGGGGGRIRVTADMGRVQLCESTFEHRAYSEQSVGGDIVVRTIRGLPGLRVVASLYALHAYDLNSLSNDAEESVPKMLIGHLKRLAVGTYRLDNVIQVATTPVVGGGGDTPLPLHHGYEMDWSVRHRANSSVFHAYPLDLYARVFSRDAVNWAPTDTASNMIPRALVEGIRAAFCLAIVDAIRGTYTNVWDVVVGRMRLGELAADAGRCYDLLARIFYGGGVSKGDDKDEFVSRYDSAVMRMISDRAAGVLEPFISAAATTTIPSVSDFRLLAQLIAGVGGVQRYFAEQITWASTVADAVHNIYANRHVYKRDGAEYSVIYSVFVRGGSLRIDKFISDPHSLPSPPPPPSDVKEDDIVQACEKVHADFRASVAAAASEGSNGSGGIGDDEEKSGAAATAMLIESIWNYSAAVAAAASEPSAAQIESVDELRDYWMDVEGDADAVPAEYVWGAYFGGGGQSLPPLEVAAAAVETESYRSYRETVHKFLLSTLPLPKLPTEAVAAAPAEAGVKKAKRKRGFEKAAVVKARVKSASHMRHRTAVHVGIGAAHVSAFECLIEPMRGGDSVSAEYYSSIDLASTASPSLAKHTGYMHIAGGAKITPRLVSVSRPGSHSIAIECGGESGFRFPNYSYDDAAVVVNVYANHWYATIVCPRHVCALRPATIVWYRESSYGSGYSTSVRARLSTCDQLFVTTHDKSTFVLTFSFGALHDAYTAFFRAAVNKCAQHDVHDGFKKRQQQQLLPAAEVMVMDAVAMVPVSLFAVAKGEVKPLPEAEEEEEEAEEVEVEVERSSFL